MHDMREASGAEGGRAAEQLAQGRRASSFQWPWSIGSSSRSWLGMKRTRRFEADLVALNGAP